MICTAISAYPPGGEVWYVNPNFGNAHLRVVADNVDDGEAIDVAEMLVGLVPDFAGDLGGGVELHAHHRFLGALAGEDVGGGSLRDLGLAGDDLCSGRGVDGRDFDELVAVLLSDVLEDDVQVGVWQDHRGEVDVVRDDALRVVLGGNLLDVASSRGRSPHAVGDGARQVGKVREVGVHVDRVDVSRDLRVGLVAGRGADHRRSLSGGDGVGRSQHDRLIQRSAVPLEVLEDGVALGRAG